MAWYWDMADELKSTSASKGLLNQWQLGLYMWISLNTLTTLCCWCIVFCRVATPICMLPFHRAGPHMHQSKTQRAYPRVSLDMGLIKTNACAWYIVIWRSRRRIATTAILQSVSATTHALNGRSDRADSLFWHRSWHSNQQSRNTATDAERPPSWETVPFGAL